MNYIEPTSGDDALLINAALAGGDDVVLSAGDTFRIATPLTIPAGRSLVSEGGAKVVCKGDNKVWANLQPGSAVSRLFFIAEQATQGNWGAILFANKAPGIRLEDVTLQGPGESAGSKGMTGAAFYGCDGLRAFRLKATQSCGGCYGIEINGGRDLMFNLLESSMNGADGVKVMGSPEYGTATDVRLIDITCNDNGQSTKFGFATNGEGVDMSGGIGIQISGAVCRGNYGPGLQVKPDDRAGAESRGIMISNCHLVGNHSNGFGIVDNSNGKNIPGDVTLINVVCEDNDNEGFNFAAGQQRRVMGMGLQARGNKGMGLLMGPGCSEFTLHGVNLTANGLGVPGAKGWNMGLLGGKNHMLSAFRLSGSESPGGTAWCQGLYVEGLPTNSSCSMFAMRDHANGINSAYYAAAGQPGQIEVLNSLFR